MHVHDIRCMQKQLQIIMTHTFDMTYSYVQYPGIGVHIANTDCIASTVYVEPTILQSSMVDCEDTTNHMHAVTLPWPFEN